MEFCAMLLCTCMFRFVRDFQFLLYIDLFYNVDFDFFLLLLIHNNGKEKKKVWKDFTRYRVSLKYSSSCSIFFQFPY